MLAKVEFEKNRPVDLALKFPDGKSVTGDYGESVMFSTTDGRVMFLAPYVANKLRQLQLKPEEPFRVEKAEVTNGGKKAVEWRFQRLSLGQQGDGTFAVPKVEGGTQSATPIKPAGDGSTVAGSPRLNHSTLSPYEHSGSAALLRDTVCMLTDVQASAMEYAKKYNGSIRPDDVRAMVLSAFINLSKGGGR